MEKGGGREWYCLCCGPRSDIRCMVRRHPPTTISLAVSGLVDESAVSGVRHDVFVRGLDVDKTGNPAPPVATVHICSLSRNSPLSPLCLTTSACLAWPVHSSILVCASAHRGYTLTGGCDHRYSALRSRTPWYTGAFVAARHSGFRRPRFPAQTATGEMWVVKWPGGHESP